MDLVKNQKLTDDYAIYNGDSCMVLPQFPDNSIHLTIYSPPFAGLYNYSSSDNDLSNCKSYSEFMDHYRFIVEELYRITLPGRISCVHVCDVPTKGNKLIDFPGDVIKLHQDIGWHYHNRHCIWKEPLRVAIRTRAKGLMHKQLVKDSTQCRTALADYVICFRKPGENKEPVIHPRGLTRYAGDNPPDDNLFKKYAGWSDPATNKLAHKIWQKYASVFWDDIRIDNILKYKKARENKEEKHVHPLQLDVIDRCVTLWSNERDKVLTPFMGVGSEVYGSVSLNRMGIGIELKETYFRQAIENLKNVKVRFNKQKELF